jgi:hypothetical protein
MHPLFNPSGSSKHLRMGSVRKPRHFLTTRMGLWCFIKSSAQNKAVYMELSLRLSFQLRCRLGGYTVGTTMGFRVITVEALDPRPHH